MRPVVLLATVAALAALAATAGVVLAVRGGEEPEYRGSPAPAALELPAFDLPGVSGERVDTASLRGKGVLVTFLDSQCEDACPAIAAAVARGLELLPPADRERVAALAISTDPDEDTPDEVERFLRRNRADGKLAYLVDDEARLRPLWREFGVLATADTGNDSVHSAPVRIYDAGGRWVSSLSVGVDLSPENVAHDLRAAAGL